MKILFKVNKEGSNITWTCKEFAITNRVANVLGSALVVKGDTAVLHGTPELMEVIHKDGTMGQRLVGLNGNIVDQLALIEAQAADQERRVTAVKADPALEFLFK